MAGNTIESDAGRVQGVSFFYSSSTNTTSIELNTLSPSSVNPMEGDHIVNANGDVLEVQSVSSSSCVTKKVNSIKGPQGSVGKPGADGTPGAPGARGADGSDGADGATWLSGSSTPSSSSGKAGDFYLNTTTWDVYKKNSSSWSRCGNIKGASGGAKYYFSRVTDGGTINKKIDLSTFGDNVLITVYATAVNREACEISFSIKSGSVSKSINGGTPNVSYLSVLFVKKNSLDVVYDSIHDVEGVASSYKVITIDRNDFTIGFGVSFSESSDYCNLLIKVEEVRAL